LTKNVNNETISGVSEIGKRLKSARQGRGLSLRKFAEEVGEDFTVMHRIEKGERFPPKGRQEKFASVLSLTSKQLDALIAVERRKLNPYELLPEIVPAHISFAEIEKAAEQILNKYRQAEKKNEIKLPVPVDDILVKVCRLNVEYCDFKRKKIPGPKRESLYGCLYPDGFGGKDRVAFVNTGQIRGRRSSLSQEERRITVAHEAGHFVMHRGNNESRQLFFRFTKEPVFCREAECEDNLLNPMEYQASVFAACLLMPRSQFLTNGNGWQAATTRWPAGLRLRRNL